MTARLAPSFLIGLLLAGFVLGGASILGIW